MLYLPSSSKRGVVIKFNMVIKFWEVEAKLNLGNTVLNNAFKFLKECTELRQCILRHISLLLLLQNLTIVTKNSPYWPFAAFSVKILTTNCSVCGFGDPEVGCWPLVPKFAGSNPAEAVGFFRAKKFSAHLPSERK